MERNTSDVRNLQTYARKGEGSGRKEDRIKGDFLSEVALVYPSLKVL